MQQFDRHKALVDYLRPYRPQRIGIFGSYARGEQSRDSDFDVLVNLNTNISLLDLVRMERELTEILGVKVDLVTEGSLQNPNLKDYVMQDLMVIFNG